jgi:formamidopyrimidine-DNA glycosylase
VSIELPEAKILEEQMNKQLRGKRVETYHLRDHERLQRIGFMNRDDDAFNRLVDREVESVVSRGNTIRVLLTRGVSLILSPEYGGEIFYHTDWAPTAKFHLKLDFSDKTALTVRLTSMGGLFALDDRNLMTSYTYKRDFNPHVLSPLEAEFTVDRFSRLLVADSRALKSVLVGKDAVLVGLSNSAFQDIVFRAKLHPKRKASELDTAERSALYAAVRDVLANRIRLNGKDQFRDLYGRRGGYTPAMGPNMKDRNCGVCGTPIEKLSVGGGHVFLCPKCQS